MFRNTIMKKVWIAAAVAIVLLLFILYLRRERYEETPPPTVPDPAPAQPDTNPALEALKAEILACGADKTCIRKALVESMKKK